jgi:hypothetical protein
LSLQIIDKLKAIQSDGNPEIVRDAFGLISAVQVDVAKKSVAVNGMQVSKPPGVQQSTMTSSPAVTGGIGVSPMAVYPVGQELAAGCVL